MDSVFRMMFIGLSESLGEPLDCKLARSWLRASVALPVLDVPVVALVELSVVDEELSVWWW